MVFIRDQKYRWCPAFFCNNKELNREFSQVFILLFSSNFASMPRSFNQACIYGASTPLSTIGKSYFSLFLMSFPSANVCNYLPQYLYHLRLVSIHHPIQQSHKAQSYFLKSLSQPYFFQLEKICICLLS